MSPGPAPTGASHAQRSGRRTTELLWSVAPRRIPQEQRRVDLRLLLPVVAMWPAVAFVGLIVPIAVVTTMAVVFGVGAAVVGWQARAARRRRWTAALALVLVALSLGLLAASGHRALRTVGPVAELAQERAVVTLHARVAAEPRPVRGGIPEDGPSERRVVVRLDVSRVSGRGLTTTVGTPVLVIAAGGWAELKWHDEVSAAVRLEPADPGDDVVAVGRPLRDPTVVGEPGLLFRAAESVRERFRQATAGLPSDARGLVPALVIGDTSRTPDDLTEAMLDTGMSHLSAVSGSNVTLVLGAAMGLCQLLALRRRHRPWIALVVLVGFVVLAHPEPSVIRAAVMGSVGLLGLSTSRRQVGVPALSAAILMLVVWDPWLSRSYGFALSSVATLGLLLFAQPWGRTISRWLPPRLAWLGPVFAVPIAAQAVCAPIVVPLQGAVSFVAVLANLLAAPLVAPTTIVGVAVAVLSPIWGAAASWIAWGAAVPALGIAWVARWCAALPYGQVGWDDTAWGALLLAGLTAFVILAAPWVWHRSRLRPGISLAVALTAVTLVVPPSIAAWPPPGWVLAACDVGQGDGLVLNAGAGAAVVVDTGPEPQLIARCLDRLDVGEVPLVVITHFHADHAGGLEGVIDGRRVGEIRATPVREPPGEAAAVEQLVSRGGIPMGTLRSGDRVRVGDVSADVWLPSRTIDAGSVANNSSVVLTAHVRGIGVLLTGDIEREAAAQLVREIRSDPTRLGAIDVYKVPHHGSSNRDDRLLEVVAGRIALISVAEDNDYGHPAPSTLKSLASNGFRVHRTDLEGDLAVVSRGGNVHVVTRGTTR